MIIGDKKKTVSVILSKLKPDGGSSSTPVKSEQQMGDPDPVKIIAEDMMLAFKNGSVLDLQDAISALIAHVQSMDEEQDEATQE